MIVSFVQDGIRTTSQRTLSNNLFSFAKSYTGRVKMNLQSNEKYYQISINRQLRNKQLKEQINTVWIGLPSLIKCWEELNNFKQGFINFRSVF